MELHPDSSEFEKAARWFNFPWALLAFSHLVQKPQKFLGILKIAAQVSEKNKHGCSTQGTVNRSPKDVFVQIEWNAW